MGELENQPITNLPVEEDQQEHSEIQLGGVIEDNPEENSLISSTPCTVPSSSDVSDDPAEKSPVEITNSIDLEVVANDSLDTVENSLVAEATDELPDNTFIAPISGCIDSVSSQRSEGIFLYF